MHHFWGDFGRGTFHPLHEQERAEFLIVGGGIAGLFAAHFLLKAGVRDIVLIERHTIGSGSTGRSAGMLVCEPETAPWSQIAERFGIELATQYWEAQVAALKTISEIVMRENIRCDFSIQELLFSAGFPQEPSAAHADREIRKRIQGKLLHDALPTMKERIKGNISVNPLRLARGIAKSLKTRGVRIYEDTTLLYAEKGHAETTGGNITYSKLIRCMGTWDKSRQIQRYFTTIGITRKLNEREMMRLGLADQGMFIDDEQQSFHYGKITAQRQLLIGYGDVACKGRKREHGMHKPHLRSIKRFLERAFPEGDVEIEQGWSAEYALSKSELPYVSCTKKTATINGAGTQLASIATASYAVSKLLGQEHALDALFSATATRAPVIG